MSKLIKSWRKIAGKAFRIGVGFSFTAVALLHVLGFAPSEVVKRLEIFPAGAEGRYVRLCVTHVPEGVRVGLADIELLGILSVR